MRTRLLAVLLLLLVLGLAWWLLGGGEADPGTQRIDASGDDAGNPVLVGPLPAYRKGTGEAGPGVSPDAASPEAPDADGDLVRLQPDLDAIRRLAFERTGGGVLEVVVRRGEEPVGEGVGLLWKGPFGGGAAGIPYEVEPDERVLLSREGTCRFEGLDAGVHYVGLQLPGEAVRLRSVQVVGTRGRNPENNRVIFALWEHAIHGRVFTAQGRPAAALDQHLRVRRGDGGVASAHPTRHGRADRRPARRFRPRRG